ncbi:peptidoglycan/xylan/chitin deacetylase (PgdA/CDA1 family) [Marmoricola sp. OAE513]|uniref:polysaccharide deacetylase family protein n=1 Tax=Marmoricola sp. OAE513 TaxID=2817894 RepID=UPI003393156E
MHRTALGALTAALALLTAALGASAVSTSTGPADARGVADLATVAFRTTPLAVKVQQAPKTKACRAGLVALTFDDGPSASVTPRLVRTLLAHDVPATFFMVGSRVKSSPATARLVQRSGFVIGNHTWDHRELPALSNRTVRGELTRTRHTMKTHGITPSNLMRPPYGAINKRVSKDVKKVGLVPVLWTVDSLDWSSGSSGQIANRVLRALRPHKKNIVLQHDGVTNSPNSVKAVSKIIRVAKKRGYCFSEIGPGGGVAYPSPKLRATVLSGTEDGATPVRVRLDLDRPTSRPVSVRVRTADGSAKAGSDYTPVLVTVSFPRGVRTAWFSIPVADDAERTRRSRTSCCGSTRPVV